jgi:5-methyltetrahydropteroyltriglutamate--homocysteine methyltransferase
MGGDLAARNRILTTHTGSLPRTPALLQALYKSERDEPVDQAQLEKDVEIAVSEAVARQVECGLAIVNDGEQSKINFCFYHYHRLNGFDHRPVPPAARTAAYMEIAEFPEFYRTSWVAAKGAPPPKYALCCTASVDWKDFSEVERDLANLKAATAGKDMAEVFMTAISPATYVPPNEFYATEQDYLFAMADVLAREYKAIVDAGFILQIDAPDLTVEYRNSDISIQQHLEFMATRIDVINHATRNLPPDRVRVHVCWGADEAPHSRDIPLKEIVGQLLRLRPHGLMVPGANGRHSHEWRVWETVKLPPDHYLVPGVIDSTTNIIEHPDNVAQRIADYCSVLGRDNVVAGVDCGFAYNQVDPKIIWAKLRSLTQGAAQASAKL